MQRLRDGLKTRLDLYVFVEFECVAGIYEGDLVGQFPGALWLDQGLLRGKWLILTEVLEGRGSVD